MRLGAKTAILLGLIVLHSMAWVLPKALIPDGLAELAPDQREVAATAAALAETGSWEKWVDRLCIIQIRVEVLSVGAPQESPAEFPRGWKVRVTAHSLFGIPYGQLVFTHDDRLSENVGFRRNASGPVGLLLLAVGTLAALSVWPRERSRHSA